MLGAIAAIGCATIETGDAALLKHQLKQCPVAPAAPGLEVLHRASESVILAMRSWVNLTASHVGPGTARLLQSRLATQSQWSRKALPAHLHQSPVMYIFSGMDLVTAAGFFPNAPEYLLVAELHPGTLECYESPGCASHAGHSARSWLGHVSGHSFSSSSTGVMMSYFKEPHGILPSLLLSLSLLGRDIVGAALSHAPGPNRSLHVLHIDTAKQPHSHNASHSRCARATYASMVLGKHGLSTDLDLLERTVVAPRRKEWALIMKAGDHALAKKFAAPAMANWSAATVQDESGFLPSQIEGAGWKLHLHGSFANFTKDQRSRWRNDAEELRAYYERAEATNQLSPLPFWWGYAQNDPDAQKVMRGHRGAMITGWRPVGLTRMA